MVVEYIRYSIDSERAQAFEQAYRARLALDASSIASATRSRAAATTPPNVSFASSGTRKRDTCRGVSPEPRVPQLLRGGRPVRTRHQ